MAALDREMAAAIHEVQADEFAVQAEHLAAEAGGDDSERRSALARSADLAMKAAAKYGAANKALEKACANWLKASAQSRKAERDAANKEYAGRAEDAHKRARAVAVNAARSFEMAADLFDADNANRPDRSAAAIEQAAAWREKLAAWK
jgi:hypothetical protein